MLFGRILDSYNRKEDAQMKLKATKTSLYKLVSEYVPLQKMKETTFYKLSCRRTYFLDWNPEGHAIFYVCSGRPLLAIRTPEGWAYHKLNLQHLITRGMTEAENQKKAV